MTRTTDATPTQASESTPTEAMFAAAEGARSLGVDLLEHGAGIAEERVGFGRSGSYDVSTLHGAEAIAEFRTPPRIRGTTTKESQ
ncbi:hypothetical protein [Streptomyces sp. 2A115]|uniref:hypothetical protein n=1 Tax=Streptomyces sp. 2A115 TaxID=3457439 RepID=UPI003FD0DD5D